jgi:hypothetical protein
VSRRPEYPAADRAAVVSPGIGDARPRAGEARADAASRGQAFTRLKWASFTHSCIYTALLLCAFAAGNPEPATFVLGLTHGLLWIAMSLACVVCVRLRIVPLRLAAAVAVLGGIGPFFGSVEFIREQRRRRAGGPPSKPVCPTGETTLHRSPPATLRARVSPHGGARDD